MKIPFPELDHWERVKSGKSFIKESLPEDYLGVTEVSFQTENGSGSTFPPSMQKVKQENTDPAFKVPEKLTNPDKLILTAKESLTAKRKYGLYRGLVNTYTGELNIRVSPDLVSRALRIMDTIIKIWRGKGYNFISEKEDVQIVINGEKISIYLREVCKRIPGTEKWSTSTYIPTGVLLLTATFYFRTEVVWKDGTKSLELQIERIIHDLERKAQEAKEYRIQIEKGWEEQREKDRKRKEVEEKKAKDLAEFQLLLTNSKRWKEASDLRLYLDAYENRLKMQGDLTAEKIEWLEWARKKADWYDPEIKDSDEIL